MERKFLASDLRERIIFKEKISTSDGAGGLTEIWSDVAEVWAEVIPIASADVFRNGRTENIKRFRIIIRYMADVTEDMRIVFGGMNLNILAITNLGNRNVAMEIIAAEEV